MKHSLIAMCMLVALSSASQAQTPFLSISDGSFGPRNTNLTIQVLMVSGNWQSVYLTAQGLTSAQVADSPYSWMQGSGNHWYCADLNSIQSGSAWEFFDTASLTAPFGEPVGGNYGTMEGLRRAAWLVDTYHSEANDAAKRASLQLAVWEAVYDNFDGGGNERDAFDHTTGAFQARAAGNASHLDDQTGLAGEWFAASHGKSGRGVYAVDGQNMLGRTEIPEPSTLVLLGLGLTVAGFGIVRKRRQA